VCVCVCVHLSLSLSLSVSLSLFLSKTEYQSASCCLSSSCRDHQGGTGVCAFIQQVLHHTCLDEEAPSLSSHKERRAGAGGSAVRSYVQTGRQALVVACDAAKRSVSIGNVGP
jgi:hypothetical protein